METAVYAASVEHRHGTDVYLGDSEEALRTDILENYVKNYWEEFVSLLPEYAKEGIDLDVPDVDIYFELNEDEFVFWHGWVNISSLTRPADYRLWEFLNVEFPTWEKAVWRFDVWYRERLLVTLEQMTVRLEDGSIREATEKEIKTRLIECVDILQLASDGITVLEREDFDVGLHS